MLSLTRSGKLFQETVIVLIKIADVVDTVQNHRDPLDSHAESKTGINFRIVTDHLKNRRMDHSATGDFDPVAADFCQMFRRKIDFKTRLRIREKVRTKTGSRVTSEKSFDKMIEKRLQIADGGDLIAIKTMGLVILTIS